MKRTLSCLLMVIMTLGASAKVDVDFSSRFTEVTFTMLQASSFAQVLPSMRYSICPVAFTFSMV